jgi:hypothetical protein
MDGFDMEYFINLGFGILSIEWISKDRYHSYCIFCQRTFIRDLIAFFCNAYMFRTDNLARVPSGYCFLEETALEHFCWLTKVNSKERNQDNGWF